MKTNTHPNYTEVEVKCACGNVIKTRSTKEDLKSVEICSKCHPFYTGKEKKQASEGRIAKFKKKYKKSESEEK